MTGWVIQMRRAIGAILAGAGTLALGGCGGAPQVANENVAAPVNTAAEPALPIPLPVPLPVLTRGDLIKAAAAATDAIAGGTAVAPGNAALLGRRFEVRLPFGCDGPAVDDTGWAGWTVNPETDALKLSARSELSGDDPWVQAVANGTEFETAEGFWVRRPWTGAETCPAPLEAREPAEAETLALIQLFTADAPRTRQRGNRPYASTTKVPDEERALPRRYRLLLEGRVAGFADRQPIRCTQASGSARPRCAIAVAFDRVAFEEAGTGTIIAEWRD